MGVKLNCSMNNNYTKILRIPYPVSMGQREESDNDLGMLVSVNWGDKEGSWNIAEEEYRPCLQSSNPWRSYNSSRELDLC